MAKKNSVNNDYAKVSGAMPYYGYGAQGPRPVAASSSNGKKGKGKKKRKLSPEKEMQRKEERRILRARQEYAYENVDYRKKVEAINGLKGADNSIYRLPKDKKPKKQKDYFFIMRKSVCFFMFLFMLVTIALFAVSYLNISAISPNYTAVFVETEAKKEETASASSGVVKADGAETPVVDETTQEGATVNGKAYRVVDPLFGFIKHVSGDYLNKEINLGESPLYDAMLAKKEMGMKDMVGGIVLEWFPVFVIVYLIIALVMMIKAFCGMFGKRVFRKFGLGSILMIVCSAVVLLAGLAFQTALDASLNYAGIVNILINFVTGAGGFAAGYGLLGMIALPLLTLILSMFCKKKIPYSIFDR